MDRSKETTVPSAEMGPHLGNSSRNRLPLELLSRIFNLCKLDLDPAVMQPHAFPLYGNKSAPVLLSGVCHSWHSIVESSPHLWTEITLYADGADQLSLHVEALRTYVMRSTHLPFSFRVRGSIVDRDTGHYLAGLFEVLNTVAHRWQWVNIDLRVRPQDLACLSGVAAVALPFLRTFNINLLGTSQGTVNATVLNKWLGWLGRASLLERTHLELTYTLLGHNDFPYPWTQIVTMTLSGEDLTCFAAHSILAQCSRLETCTITVSTRNIMGSVGNTRLIEVPCLKRLKIFARTEIGTLLDSLSMPALTELDIEGAFDEDRPRDSGGESEASGSNDATIWETARMGGYDAAGADTDAEADSDSDSDDGGELTDEHLVPSYALVEAFSHASRLQSLRLDQVYFGKDRLIKALRHSPSGLRVLTIGYKKWRVPKRLNIFTRKLFRAFEAGNAARGFLPQLQHLTINLYNQFPGDALLDVLESRFLSADGLSTALENMHLRFDYDCGLYQEDWDRLDALVAHGHVSYEGPEGDWVGGPDRCVLMRSQN